MPFFAYYPNTKLDIFGDGTEVEIVDLFRAVGIIEDRLRDLSLYVPYRILNGARPDQVSQELYGDSEFHWTFFIVNDRLRSGMKEWPMSDFDLDQYVQDIHEHYGSVELKAFSEGRESNPNNHNLLYGLDISSPHIAIEDVNTGYQFPIVTYRSDRQQIGLQKGGIAKVIDDGVDKTQTYNPAFPPYFRIKSSDASSSGGLCQAVLTDQNTIDHFRIVDFGKGYRTKPTIITDFTPEQEAILTFTVPDLLNVGNALTESLPYGAIPTSSWLGIYTNGKGYIDKPFVEVQRSAIYDRIALPYHFTIDTNTDGTLNNPVELIYPADYDFNQFGSLMVSDFGLPEVNGTYHQFQKGNDSIEEGIFTAPALTKEDSITPFTRYDAHYAASTNKPSYFDENTVWIQKGKTTTANFQTESGYYFIHCSDDPNYPMYCIRYLIKEDNNISAVPNFEALTNSLLVAYTDKPYTNSQELLHPGDPVLNWIIPFDNMGILLDAGGFNTQSIPRSDVWKSNYANVLETAGRVRSYVSPSKAGYIVEQTHSVIAGNPPSVYIPPIDRTSGSRAIEDLSAFTFQPHNGALEGTQQYNANAQSYSEWKDAYDVWKASTQIEVFSDVFETIVDAGGIEGETYQDSSRAKTDDERSYYELYRQLNESREPIRVVKPEYIREFVRIFKDSIKG